MGNPASYGIRNMVATTGSLFIGTANPSNLLTGATGPKGGWELIELKPRATTPIDLLTRFSCRHLHLHDDDDDDNDDHHSDEELGSGTTTCVVRASGPAPPGGLTVGVISLSPEIAVDVPLEVFIPEGETHAHFSVEVTDAAPHSRALLMAGMNGGTRITSLDISSADHDGCHRR